MNDADELARSVAADLGPDVLAAVDHPADDTTRSFGISEAAAIAGLLVQCAQLAHQLWQAKEDRALLVAALADSDKLMRADAHQRLDPDRRLGYVARVLQKMLPGSFDPPLVNRTAGSMTDKQRWIQAYVEERRRAALADKLLAREFRGATILLPFADQRWWALWQAVGWIPAGEDGPGVIRVDVPRGFVTDLASIPFYLWAVLQRTGRYGNAAIYHDWLYWMQDEVPGNDRAVADQVFDRAMHDMGVEATTRRLIWAGVRVFGGRHWDANRAMKAAGERRVLQRFPEDPTVTWESWRQLPDVFASS